jgi:hypothetical protein
MPDPVGRGEQPQPAMVETQPQIAIAERPLDRVDQRLWCYNYDFEFELAGLPPVTAVGASSFPWFYLNRSAIVLLPLTRPGDRLVVYETATEIETLLKDRLGYLPSFLKLTPTTESNAVLDDFLEAFRTTDLGGPKELAPWGWSPKAFALHHWWGLGSRPMPREERISDLNSKRTSHDWRETLLSPAWSIPSVFLERSKTTPAVLSERLASFFGSVSDGYIKHPFGTSGRLSERCTAGSFSRRQLRRWYSWILSGGGVLIERALPVVREWSLQLEFNPQGTCCPVALTRMLTGPAGQYLGNVIHQTDQDRRWSIFDQLKPISVEMTQQGYLGPAGLDLIETDDGRLRLLEINARLTMGRIAAAWYQALGSPMVGLFINRFLSTDNPPRPDRLIAIADQTTIQTGCPITLINFVAPPTARRCLLSLFISGRSETEVYQAFQALIVKAGLTISAFASAAGPAPI